MKYIILLAILLIPSYAYSYPAVTRYVDDTGATNCSTPSDTDYDPATGICGSGSDLVYSTINAAVQAVTPGDSVIIRGGTYEENSILLDTNQNGSAWTSACGTGSENCFNTIASYPGEWAIIDGTNTGNPDEPYRGAIFCGDISSPTASNFRKFWKFERFEITGGMAIGGASANGIALTGGPLWFRYLYIHDNNPTSSSANSSGIRIQEPNDVIIEYCYFKDNGYEGTDRNSANITFYADYNHVDIVTNGFDPEDSANVGARSNTIRYNLIEGSAVGVKHKSFQAFSSRTGSGEMTYQDWGDDWHHNFVTGANQNGLLGEQDFMQIHNNIVEDTVIGISSDYALDSRQVFKPVYYNNTIINSSKSGVVHFSYKVGGISPDFNYNYSYTYNNLTDSFSTDNTVYQSFSVASAYTATSMPTTGSYITKNYAHNPDGGITTDLYSLGITRYTNTEFEAQTETASPRVGYVKAYDSGDTLFVDTTGADQYITRGVHEIESGTTIADGGLGGAHPYLSGVTIPSYVGATNPDDNGWVAGVLALDVSYFTNAEAGSEPSWIEGHLHKQLRGASLSGGTLQ